MEKSRLKSSVSKALANESLRHLISCSAGQEKAVAEIAARLMIGSENVRQGKRDGNGVDPTMVAIFIAAVATCSESDLPKVVEEGLAQLGVVRNKPGRGRPRGSRVEGKYLQFFEGAAILDNEDKLWEQKQLMKARYPRDWQRRLRNTLRAQRWKEEWITYLIASHNQKAFHTNIVALHFDRTYEAVERSLRRAIQKRQRLHKRQQ